MASGSDLTVDEQGAHEHPSGDEPVGGHDDHGHDDDHGHGGHDDAHADHATGGDAWVLIPIGIGLLIGLLLALYFGLGSGASPLN